MSRRPNLPRGYSARDMSDDFAGMIHADIGDWRSQRPILWRRQDPTNCRAHPERGTMFDSRRWHAVVKTKTKIFEDKFSSFFNEGEITAAGALLMSVSTIILAINTAGIVENDVIIVISSVQKFLLNHSPRSVE